jgi:hypothetical protein
VVELKVFVPHEVLDVAHIPRYKIVHPQDPVAFGNEAVAEMTPEESCCSSNEGAFHIQTPIPW